MGLAINEQRRRAVVDTEGRRNPTRGPRLDTYAARVIVHRPAVPKDFRLAHFDGHCVRTTTGVFGNRDPERRQLQGPTGWPLIERRGQRNGLPKGLGLASLENQPSAVCGTRFVQFHAQIDRVTLPVDQSWGDREMLHHSHRWVGPDCFDTRNLNFVLGTAPDVDGDERNIG